MAGVTPEQLDEAGMLYIDEQKLLQGSEDPNVGRKNTNRGKKPPSGDHKEWRRRASSITAVKAVSGLAATPVDPGMCKACLLSTESPLCALHASLSGCELWVIATPRIVDVIATHYIQFGM